MRVDLRRRELPVAGDLRDDLDRDPGSEHIGNGAVPEIMEPGVDAAIGCDLAEPVGDSVGVPIRENATDILPDGLQGLDNWSQKRDYAFPATLAPHPAKIPLQIDPRPFQAQSFPTPGPCPDVEGEEPPELDVLLLGLRQDLPDIVRENNPGQVLVVLPIHSRFRFFLDVALLEGVGEGRLDMAEVAVDRDLRGAPGLAGSLEFLEPLLGESPERERFPDDGGQEIQGELVLLDRMGRDPVAALDVGIGEFSERDPLLVLQVDQAAPEPLLFHFPEQGEGLRLVFRVEGLFPPSPEFDVVDAVLPLKKPHGLLHRRTPLMIARAFSRMVGASI